MTSAHRTRDTGHGARRTALWGLLKKEVYHILRDRRTLAVLILFPIVQVVLFGYSIRTDVKDVRLAIVDPTPDPMTRAIRDRFTATDVFRFVALVPSEQRLAPLFERGDVQLAIVFPAQFAERARSPGGAQLLFVTDASEPNSGSARLAYANAVIQEYVVTAGGTAPRIEARIRSRFNPTRASANLFVPGLTAMVLTIISALMTALSLTREKETGTMEALLVSPLKPWQIVVGKVAPYLVIGFLSVILVLGEAHVIFKVPVHGSVALLLAEGGLFILVALSLGILISARTSSQRVAMIAALVVTMLPTTMLSGFIFPIDSMPRPLAILSNIIPARWFVAIARGVMLKGVGIDYLWKETLVLAVMATVLLFASARSFHPRLD